MHRRTFISAATACALTPVAAWANHLSYALEGEYVYPNPYARAWNDWSKPRVSKLITLGDSYSDLAGPTAPNTWSRQLVAEGSADSIRSYAQGGAGASSVAFPRNRRPLSDQVDMWLSDKSDLCGTDLTVVYFGQNDIEDDTFALSTSFTGMRSAIKRLQDEGATADGRYVFLVLCHNITQNPFHRAYMATRYASWRGFLLGLDLPERFIIVDMGTVIDEVRRRPYIAGLTNIRDPRDALPYLYRDAGHFGLRGNAVIADTVRYYLTRGWDDAHRYRAGSAEARSRIVSAISAGNLIR